MKSAFRVGPLLKGMLMGAADVVPGVSGGTIAFITGIYEELINSIKNINFNLISVLRKEGFWAFYKKANLGFLLPLFVGVAISILSLAKLVTYVLAEYPVLTWAFFFGLILASAIYIGRQIKKWSFSEIALLVLGIAVAYWISIISPSDGNESIWYAALCGALAICAMILPGISGSLILLLLGMYVPIFTAISELDFGVILPVAVGAIIGIISFSHVLSYLFKKYRSQTLALLTGFMIGALNKVWPWKKVMSTYVDSHGEVQPLLEKSISPSSYQAAVGLDAQLLLASLLAVLGFVVVFLIERLAKSDEKS